MNTTYDLHFFDRLGYLYVRALTDRGRAFLSRKVKPWHPPLYAAALDAGLRVSFETQEVMRRVTNA